MSIIDEKELDRRFLQAEVRLRQMWKADMQAILRGHLNELLSHVDMRIQDFKQQIQDCEAKCNTRSDRYYQSLASDREYWDRYRQSFHDETLAIVLEALKDYYIVDENLNVLGPDQRPLPPTQNSTVKTPA